MLAQGAANEVSATLGQKRRMLEPWKGGRTDREGLYRPSRAPIPMPRIPRVCSLSLAAPWANIGRPSGAQKRGRNTIGFNRACAGVKHVRAPTSTDRFAESTIRVVDLLPRVETTAA
jgi:hypothetical protein